jgi:PAS domain-containing protein
MIHPELKILEAIAFCILMAYLWRLGARTNVRTERGWSFMLLGLVTILSALALGATESFAGLSKFVVVGDTACQRFLKDEVLFPLGSVFVTVGVVKLLSCVDRAGNAEAKFRKALSELEMKVIERTADLPEANEQLWREMVERRSVEMELRRSKENYRLLFENVSEIVYSLHPALNFAEISPSVEHLLGHSYKEVAGKFLSQLIEISDRSRAAEDAGRVMAGERIDGSMDRFISS